MTKLDDRIALLERLVIERRTLAGVRRETNHPMVALGELADRIILRCLEEARRQREDAERAHGSKVPAQNDPERRG